MGKWEEKQWREVLDIINGRSQKNVIDSKGDYPIYGSGGIMGYANEYICEENTVIIGRKGNINKPIFVEEKFWNVDTAFGLKARKKILEPKFLYYFCVAFNFEKLNTTVTIPSLTKVNLLKVRIPLPPLDVQKKIGCILDTVSDLIALRKRQLTELDNLIKSTFHDIFGDPVTNPMGWDYCLVEKTIKVLEAGWSANGIQRKKEDDEKAVLRVSAVTSGYFREKEYKVLDENLEIKKYVFPHKGDLLFSRANTRELVGATCMIFEDYPDLLLPDKLWRIEFNILTNFVYMKYILSEDSIRSNLSNLSTGTSGSMYNVSMDKLKSVSIPLPPKQLQEHFAEIVIRLEEQKTLIQKAINESQYLFDSLMSEYFN